MAKNLTNAHKKLDKIMQKLSTLDAIKDEQREMRLQTRYLAQMVNISQQMLQEQRRATTDIATMTEKALDAARQSAERTAAILAEIRKR